MEELRVLLFQRKLTIEEIKILENHFPYYRHLGEKHKIQFRKKLQIVLSSKKFQGRGGITEVTSEMEILIGATLVMVTFGWSRLRLAHFHTIVIYPNTYYSTLNKVYHRGEVNPKHGLIVVSWKCFVEGLADGKDGVNLGIHEIAHALKLANQIDSDGEKEFDQQAWATYKNLAPLEIQKIISGQNRFFRESASLNEHEFFAVALESFFERPEDFQKDLPELYDSLVMLLRQNPIVLKKNQ
ncbi:zinc-dependent peptidase [Algoriphagus lacus]|nr:zinc-dependent peptidase [Algoriphagus lacus]